MIKLMMLAAVLVLLNACATTGKGEFQVSKAGELEFAIPATPDRDDAYLTLSKASFDVCKAVMDRGFNISKTDEQGILLLARVRCVGTVDPYLAIKYGSTSRKIKINRIEENANHFSFSYLTEAD